MFSRLICLVNLFTAINGNQHVIYAINLGGDAHTDLQGISYQKDNGQHFQHTDDEFTVLGVPEEDQQIYQSYFWDPELNIQIPINGSGTYLLILKFSVPCKSRRWTDVTINGQHKILQKFSVYKQAGGYDTAYDEHVLFTICNGKMLYRNETSVIKDNKFKFQLKCSKTCSRTISQVMISAIVLLKGDADQMAKRYPLNRLESLPHECQLQ
jgi:hypothetical protein